MKIRESSLILSLSTFHYSKINTILHFEQNLFNLCFRKSFSFIFLFWIIIKFHITVHTGWAFSWEIDYLFFPFFSAFDKERLGTIAQNCGSWRKKKLFWTKNCLETGSSTHFIWLREQASCRPFKVDNHNLSEK